MALLVWLSFRLVDAVRAGAVALGSVVCDTASDATCLDVEGAEADGACSTLVNAKLSESSDWSEGGGDGAL